MRCVKHKLLERIYLPYGTFLCIAMSHFTLLYVLQGIVVRTRDMVQAVNALIVECGLTGRLPSAVCKPGLYF